MSAVALNDSIDLDELCARLRKMTDAELLRFGQAAKYMCSPGANFGKPPREVFLFQLLEAREEWKRRRPIQPNESWL